MPHLDEIFIGSITEVLMRLADHNIYLNLNPLSDSSEEIKEFVNLNCHIQYENLEDIAQDRFVSYDPDTIDELLDGIVLGGSMINMGDQMPLRLFIQCWTKVNEVS